MPTKIKSNVVDIGFNRADVLPEDVTYNHGVDLEDYTKKSMSIPVMMFGESVNRESVNSAISYLLYRGYGSVEVPKTDIYLKDLKIVLRRTSSGDCVVNFITSGSFYPTSSDVKRPYIEEDWNIGDTILNTDIASVPCVGWICVESGTPGRWDQFGDLGKWANQIDTVKNLPDASESQVGRQVRLIDSNGIDKGLYLCVRYADNSYRWVLQNILLGTEDNRPVDPKEMILYYNTTEGVPQWYDVDKKEWKTVCDKESCDLAWDKFEKDLEEVKKSIQTSYDNRLDSIELQDVDSSIDVKEYLEKIQSGLSVEDLLSYIRGSLYGIYNSISEIKNNSMEKLIVYDEPTETIISYITDSLKYDEKTETLTATFISDNNYTEENETLYIIEDFYSLLQQVSVATKSSTLDERFKSLEDRVSVLENKFGDVEDKLKNFEWNSFKA